MKKEIITYAATIIITFVVSFILGVKSQKQSHSGIDELKTKKIEALEVLIKDYRLLHAQDSIELANKESITQITNYYQIKQNELKNDTNSELVLSRFRWLLSVNRRNQRSE